MKNIKLLEGCGYGSIGDVVPVDDHTADYLIKTERGYEVRGEGQGVDGFAVESVGLAKEHINEVNIENGNAGDIKHGKESGPSGGKAKAN
jgi:hypothetical protein